MRRGFTLIELLVVLILLGMAVGLVAPALIPRRASEESAVAGLVRSARERAARRGETLYLELATSGQWRLDGAASLREGPLASGQLEDFRGLAATLVVSPIGTCAFDVRSGRARQAIALDPLTCEVRSP